MKSEIPTIANKRALWVSWAFYKNIPQAHKYCRQTAYTDEKKSLKNKCWHSRTWEKKNCFKELVVPNLCLYYNDNSIETICEYVLFYFYYLFICLLGCTMWFAGSYFTNQGLSPCPQWEHWVLTIRQPGNAQRCVTMGWTRKEEWWC